MAESVNHIGGMEYVSDATATESVGHRHVTDAALRDSGQPLSLNAMLQPRVVATLVAFIVDASDRWAIHIDAVVS